MAVQVSVAEKFSGWAVVACLDNNGKLIQRTKEVEFASSVTTYTAAITALTAWVDDLDGVNEADIIEYGIRAKFPSNGTLPTVVGNVFKEAILSLFPSDGSEKISHTIYSPDDTLAPAGGGVNTGYVNLGAYLDNFEAAGALRLSDGESIAVTPQIAAARIRTVASRE